MFIFKFFFPGLLLIFGSPLNATRHFNTNPSHVESVTRGGDVSKWQICVKLTCRSGEFVLKWQILRAEKDWASCGSDVLRWGVRESERDPNFRISDKNWVKKDLINPHTLEIRLEDLKTGKNYMFRICTQNAAGRSRWVYIGPIMIALSLIDPRILVPKQYRNPGVTVKGRVPKIFLSYFSLKTVRLNRLHIFS